MPQLKGLCNSSYEVVNFSIMVSKFGFHSWSLVRTSLQMAQQVMPHITDAKEHKSEFKLETVMTLIKQTVALTVGKGLKSDLSHWEAATESMAQLVQDAGRLLPLTMESENVMKSK
jgi:dynactin 1